ncbi:MAG: VCBS repeat-containing protein [Desulfobacterales bacterium]|nr:VCBS repeat-containing protein [Desulfobacterales bacterium]
MNRFKDQSLQSIFIQIVVCISILLYTLQDGHANEPDKHKKLLVLPFAIHSETDIDYMRTGIKSMLFSRLSQIKDLECIDYEVTFPNSTYQRKTSYDMQFLNEVSQASSSHYVLTWSLTVIGKQMSIDANLYCVQSNKVVMNFNHMFEKQDQIVHFSDQLANEIIRYFDALNPNTLQASESEKMNPSKVWKSDIYKGFIKGFCVVDADGDQKKEIVWITDEFLNVYRKVENDFVRVFRKKIAPYEILLSIDAADMNHNKIPELYITAIRAHSSRVNSFVIEWNGNEYERLVKKQPWFFRIQSSPTSQPVFLGQKQGITSCGFSSGLYVLGWDDGKINALKKKEIPDNTDIYKFIWGDILHTGEQVLLTYAARGSLEVYDPNNNLVWSGGTQYGGESVYLDCPKKGSSEPADRIYLNPRMIIADIDHDTKYELIVVSNYDGASRLLTRYRHYTRSHVEILCWNNNHFVQKGISPSMTGFISDISLTDMDNDGYDDLVMAVNEYSGVLDQDPKSYLLIAYRANEAFSTNRKSSME